MSQHDVQSLRGPVQWAELYARSYAELAAIVESFIDGLVSSDELRELYHDHTTRHYDEVRGEVERATAALRTRPPE